MAGQVFSGNMTGPSSKIEISLSCRNLLKLDLTSKSDPMVVMYMKQFSYENWTEIGRTEQITNCQDPDFETKIFVDYFFELRQFLKFEVYDIDSKSSRLSDHDFLGQAECTFGQIVSAPNNVLRLKLMKSKGQSKGEVIAVHAEEVVSSKEVISLQFRGYKLENKDGFFGKSDPFLVFSRSTEDQRWIVCHKTEVIKNNLNPEWKQFTVKAQKLCNGDFDRAIKVECFDYDKDGGHDLIGEFIITLRELSQGPGEKTSYQLLNKKKKKAGMIFLMAYSVTVEATFVDYVKGGCQLNCTIAIDFTASNGHPRDPRSLHYMPPGGAAAGAPCNQYVGALTAVGDIIQDYDSDKLFAALGFGAKFADGTVSHEFFLNQHPNNPYCQGIDGVLAAYLYSIQNVQLYGPTNFAPVINHVARFAAAKQDGSMYFILLILTDGVITDMPQTKEALVHASSLPMSVIIVGVGGAEFDSMEELDADLAPLQAPSGRCAERDIVQFVPFRNFLDAAAMAPPSSSVGPPSGCPSPKELLAREVLAEIPGQVVAWMSRRGIRPRPASTDYLAAVNQFGAAAAQAAAGGDPSLPSAPPPS